MNILITGSEGFIGSNLVGFFNNQNDTNYITSKIGRSVDLLNFEQLSLTLKEINPTVIIHCAGASSVADSFNNPAIDFEKNVLTTRNLLEYIRRENKEVHLIYLSSAAVYGNTESNSIVEETTLSPISPYGYSKVCAETLIKQYERCYDLNCSVLRVFSVYGGQMSKQVIYDIFTKFYDENSATVRLLGTGEETRDFIHIYDLCKVIELILSKRIFGIYNIATGQSYSIKHIAEVIQKCIGSEKEIIFIGDSRVGDPIKWRVDVSKIRDRGFVQEIHLEEGIKKYYEWFKNRN